MKQVLPFAAFMILGALLATIGLVIQLLATPVKECPQRCTQPAGIQHAVWRAP